MKMRERGNFPSEDRVYFSEINETPLLAADQEKELAYRIRKGDLEARNHLVRANLRLVVKIARNYTGRGLHLQDLIEEGNLGVLRATEGFNPEIGTRFSTYSVYWIKQAIYRALANTSRTVRIPAYMLELLTTWKRARSQLKYLLDRKPSDKEICRRLELPLKKIDIIRKALLATSYIPQNDESENSFALDEMLPDESVKPPVVEVIEEEELDALPRYLDILDDRESEIILRLYGMNGSEPENRAKIGNSMMLTRERIRQIEAEALDKMTREATRDLAMEREVWELIQMHLYKETDLLEEQEREILIRHNGLDGNAPITPSKIGESLKLTTKNVRSIETEVIRKLTKESKKIEGNIDGKIEAEEIRRLAAKKEFH